MTPQVKCVIFDLDGTLFGETLFNDAETILKKFNEAGVKQALASFNPHANFYCKRYGIDKYFSKICAGSQDDHKLGYIRDILKHLDVKEEECLFIDDDDDNICTITAKTKLKCLQVNPDEGVRINQVQHYWTASYINNTSSLIV